MSTTRKRDDPHEGYLYRVSSRIKGSDEDWEHTSFGHYGAPRTYMTLSAARGMKTRMERAMEDSLRFTTGATFRREFEFRVERAPVTEWEPVTE